MPEVRFALDNSRQALGARPITERTPNVETQNISHLPVFKELLE